ncbi:hypothetical protein QCA50_008158 [Cerrena zonata]|uniref:Uncharacterized protein n=1 Tax=Cerrena zonata TaxID=2478898 RepID=A0AAW0G566_9APHY
MTDQRHVASLQYFPPNAWSQGKVIKCDGSTGTTTNTTMVSTTPGSYATFMFHGHLLTISGVKAPNGGQLNITANNQTFLVDLDSGSTGETCAVLFNQTFPVDLYRVNMTLLAGNTPSPEVKFTDISYFDMDGPLSSGTNTNSPKSSIDKTILIVLVVGGTLAILIPTIFYFIRRRKTLRSHQHLRPDRTSQVQLTSDDLHHIGHTSPPPPLLEPLQPPLTQIIVPSTEEEDDGMRERRTSTVLSYGRTDHLVSSTSALVLRQNENGKSHPNHQPPSSDRTMQILGSRETHLSESSTRPLIREWTRPVPSSWKPPVREDTRPIPNSWRPTPKEETRPLPRTIGIAAHPTGGLSGNMNISVGSTASVHYAEPNDQVDTLVSSTPTHSAYPPSPPNENEDPTSPRVRRPLLRVDTTASTLSVASSSRSSSRRTRKAQRGRESKPPVYSPGLQPPSYVQAVHLERVDV